MRKRFIEWLFPPAVLLLLVVSVYTSPTHSPEEAMPLADDWSRRMGLGIPEGTQCVPFPFDTRAAYCQTTHRHPDTSLFVEHLRCSYQARRCSTVPPVVPELFMHLPGATKRPKGEPVPPRSAPTMTERVRSQHKRLTADKEEIQRELTRLWTYTRNCMENLTQDSSRDAIVEARAALDEFLFERTRADHVDATALLLKDMLDKEK